MDVRQGDHAKYANEDQNIQLIRFVTSSESNHGVFENWKKTTKSNCNTLKSPLFCVTCAFASSTRRAAGRQTKASSLFSNLYNVELMQEMLNYVICKRQKHSCRLSISRRRCCRPFKRERERHTTTTAPTKQTHMWFEDSVGYLLLSHFICYVLLLLLFYCGENCDCSPPCLSLSLSFSPSLSLSMSWISMWKIVASLLFVLLFMHALVTLKMKEKMDFLIQNNSKIFSLFTGLIKWREIGLCFSVLYIKKFVHVQTLRVIKTYSQCLILSTVLMWVLWNLLLWFSWCDFRLCSYSLRGAEVPTKPTNLLNRLILSLQFKNILPQNASLCHFISWHFISDDILSTE